MLAAVPWEALGVAENAAVGLLAVLVTWAPVRLVCAGRLAVVLCCNTKAPLTITAVATMENRSTCSDTPRRMQSLESTPCFSTQHPCI